jgi:hypothetical protein
MRTRLRISTRGVLIMMTITTYNEQERKNTIRNPYYPNIHIHWRILDIPFSMIILDGIEVGLELLDSNNPKEFFLGVWIKD